MSLETSSTFSRRGDLGKFIAGHASSNTRIDCDPSSGASWGTASEVGEILIPHAAAVASTPWP